MNFIKKYSLLNSFSVFALNLLIYFISLFLEFRFIFTEKFYTEDFKYFSESQLLEYIKKDQSSEFLNYIFAFLML